jgi:hypothetical protein
MAEHAHQSNEDRSSAAHYLVGYTLRGLADAQIRRAIDNLERLAAEKPEERKYPIAVGWLREELEWRHG